MPLLSRVTTHGAPLLPPPQTLGLSDVESAETAHAGVALPDLLTNVPRAAAHLPLVNACIAAEGPPRSAHDCAAPPADCLADVVAIRLAPVVSSDGATPNGTHARLYRQENPRTLQRTQEPENPRTREPANPRTREPEPPSDCPREGAGPTFFAKEFFQ